MKQILIIEDQASIRRMLELNLKIAGYETISIEDGTAALVYLNGTPRCDLALVDVMLPGVDGFALLPRLNELGIPVIFLTARGDLEARLQGLTGGAEDYIVKPFDMPELLVRMDKVLAFFMLWLGLWRGRRAAFLGSLGFSLYGFLLRKETVTALLRLGPAESFRASVLLGWISPLNHASYAMHSFGYDRLPTLETSFALYLGLLAALFFFARRSVRRYHFLFWGRQGDL